MAELAFRLGRQDEQDLLRKLIIDSFEPITWFKQLDSQFGPLNGCDWRTRWNQRLDAVFASQIILVGEAGGEVVAAATGTYDPRTRLGFVDLLAVALPHQGRGYGRGMLRGMIAHLRGLGAEYAHLECLSDNDRGNALYRSEGWQPVASSIKWFTRIGRPEAEAAPPAAASSDR